MLYRSRIILIRLISFLYSEDYLKYKHLLEDGMYVFVKARVEQRFDSPDQLVVKINSMILLSDVMEKFSRGIISYGLSRRTQH